MEEFPKVLKAGQSFFEKLPRSRGFLRGNRPLMDSLNQQQWDQLILGLRDGDPRACEAFWARFGGPLQAVAENQLSARLRRRIGSDDVVQSACRTFFRRISAGQFDLPDAEALWRLMCAITLTKARRAARDHGRKKRGLAAEQYLDGGQTDADARPLDVPAGDPTPLDAAMFADQLQQLLGALTAQECHVLDLRLQNFNNEEIAQKIGCSERTVRRVTVQLRERWHTLFDEIHE
jgi:RNA polymerase sigma factor (sigma-70 family)